MLNKLIPLLLLQFVFVSNCCLGREADNNAFKHPFYIGALGGTGSTTWEGLVPSQENLNLALSMSTPIRVEEGGYVWGLFTGYEFTPYFALEGSYIKYPKATVVFDSMSLFSFKNNGLTEFTTHTESLYLMGKIMLFLPNTKMRVYSSFGAANMHRSDMNIDQWRVGPSFGVGLNYHLTEQIMAEFGANYTAGFGESQLSPTESYFPFLYSVAARLAYCF